MSGVGPVAGGSADQRAELGAPPSWSTWARLAAPALILAVALGVFWNTLGWGFTLDDEELILFETGITRPEERAGYVRAQLIEVKPWRALQRVSLVADYAVWMDHQGESSHWSVGVPLLGDWLQRLRGPGGFHLTNVALHGAVCLLLYALICRIGASRATAVTTALLFAVHPIHSEAIANISHRKEPMALLFYLLAFHAYLTARRGRPPLISGSGLAARLGWLRGPWLARAVALEFLGYALLAYLCSWLSKEAAAVMLPAMLLVYEVLLAPGARRLRLRWLAVTVGSFALVGGYFVLRGQLGSILSRLNAEHIAFLTSDQTDSYRVLLQGVARAFAEYVWLLLWPSPLYPIRAFPFPPPSAWVIAGVAALLVYLAGLWWTARRSPLGCFALAWYGLNLLPVINVMPLTHWFVADRFVYGPSVGFALLLAVGLEALATTGRSGRALRVALVLALVAVHGTLTWRQNQIWRDQKTLWSHTLRFHPGSHHANHNYGLELQREGDLAAAVPYFERAAAARPDYPAPHIGLALAAIVGGDCDAAIRHATRFAELEPSDARSHMVIGACQLRMGRYPQAAAAYEQALALAPNDANSCYNLANTLRALGRRGRALEVVEMCIQRQPSAELDQLRSQILALDPAPRP